jgi:hypothetical protein
MAEQNEQDLKKARYLRAIALTGTLTAGCKAARVSPHTVYQWREHDEPFSIAEHEARNAFADALEQEAVRRAWHGVQKPVYHEGRIVGHVRELSDVLLMFMLKALRPEKFRERMQLQHAGANGEQLDLAALVGLARATVSDADPAG